MARIRTIKPEFWTSESIGRLSRDARLLFIALWSLADDSGRLRGVLPYLSGAILPYDRDALKLLPTWLDELQREGVIRRYVCSEGNHYIDIPKWLKHQKIEKPSPSRIPEFTEASPNTPRSLPEGSPSDLGSRTVVPSTSDLGSNSSPAAPSDSGFGEFWNAYGKKTGRKPTLAKWSKMKPEDRAAALAGVAAFVAAHPDPKFRKDPVRYLSNESWNDETPDRPLRFEDCPHAPNSPDWFNWCVSNGFVTP